MTDDQMTDLKQFVTTSFSQQASQLKTELRAELWADIGSAFRELGDEMNAKFTIVMDMIDTSNDANGDQLKNHERRIRRLEKKLQASS